MQMLWNGDRAQGGLGSCTRGGDRVCGEVGSCVGV